MGKLIEEVEKYFARNGNLVISVGKVHIRMRGDFFTMRHVLEEKNKDQCEKYELYDEAKGVKHFLHAYQISSIEDLWCVSAKEMWESYKAGRAEVIFTMGNEVKINFRVVGGKTKVFSSELKYYAEMNKVPGRLEDFKVFLEGCGIL